MAPVHYSMDPEKDSAWLAGEKAKYASDGSTEADWQREMEINLESVAGTPAYVLGDASIVPDLVINPALPICLCCDFNYHVMIWLVGQVQGGRPVVISEIELRPANITQMVREFRNLYPAHPSEIWVYGDASGRGKHAGSGSSIYELIMAEMITYPQKVILKVPYGNPPVRDRVNAVNAVLAAPETGESKLLINKTCKRLINDLRSVSWNRAGTDLQKSSDPRSPDYYLTHASDALGYWIARDFPVILNKNEKDEKAKPLVYKDLAGGFKW